MHLCWDINMVENKIDIGPKKQTKNIHRELKKLNLDTNKKTMDSSEETSTVTGVIFIIF